MVALVAFEIFLSLVFGNLNMMCSSMDFFGFIFFIKAYLALWLYRIYAIFQIWEIFSQYFLKYFSTLFLFYFGGTEDKDV